MGQRAVFRLGAVTLDSSRNEVSGPAGRVHLQPRVADFAGFLARRADEVVSREKLIEAVWRGYPGADQSLTNAASKLREALDDVGGDREQLQTVPKRGYRLAGPVEILDEDAKRLRRRWLAAAGAVGGTLLALAAIIGFLYWPAGETEARPRLVVLPLESLGPETERYLALGLTEEITTRLASVGDVDVISRTSAMQYADGDAAISTIADELGVDYLLEGSVQWQEEDESDDGRIRINTQLIRADDDVHLWAATYDRPLRDIFEVQEQIAGAVVKALEVRLLESEPRFHSSTTDSVEAYDLYLAGRYRFHRRGQGTGEDRRAIELFERAVETDPEFAPAWSGIADFYTVSPGWWLETYMDREAVAERALTAARRAVELDPELAEAHASLGRALLKFTGDAEQGRAHLRKAIELNPGYATAHQWLGGAYRRAGRLSEALPLLERAAALDPLNNIVITWYARTLGAMGRYEEAVAELQRVLKYTPESEQVLNFLFTEAFRSGRFVRAHDWVRRWQRVHEGSAKYEGAGASALFWRVNLEVALGRFEAAQTWLERLHEAAPEAEILRRGSHFWLLNGMGEYERLQEVGTSLTNLDLPATLHSRTLNAHGHASLLNGDFDAAIQSLESAGDWSSWRYQSMTQGLLAYAYVKAGRPEAGRELASETLALLEDTESHGNRRPALYFRRAAMLALLNRREEAFKALNQAYKRGWRHYHGVTLRPFLDQQMNDEERYRKFMQRVREDILAMQATVNQNTATDPIGTY